MGRATGRWAAPTMGAARHRAWTEFSDRMPIARPHQDRRHPVRAKSFVGIEANCGHCHGRDRIMNDNGGLASLGVLGFITAAYIFGAVFFGWTNVPGATKT